MSSNKNYLLTMTKFESTTIEKHYNSKRSMAFAYLMTVGSKALIIMDSLVLDSDNDSTTAATMNAGVKCNNDTSSIKQLASMMEALDEESEIKRDIVLEEEAVKSLKKFQMSIMNEPGILLFKRGRNGKTRRIFIQLCCSSPQSSSSASSAATTGDCLVWKSHSMIGGQKLFQLDTLKSIQVLKEHELEQGNGNKDSSDNSNKNKKNYSGSSKVSKSSAGSNNSNNTKIDTAGSTTASVPKPSPSSSDPIINQTSSSHHHHRKMSSSFSPISLITTDYIRLTNENRSLDIKFYSASDSIACIRFLSSYLLNQNNNSNHHLQ